MCWCFVLDKVTALQVLWGTSFGEMCFPENDHGFRNDCSFFWCSFFCALFFCVVAGIG